MLFCFQVYQARLRPNGLLVAVKVQRPGVRPAMALDLFILRKLAGFVKSLLKLNTDLPVKSLFFSLFQLTGYALRDWSLFTAFEAPFSHHEVVSSRGCDLLRSIVFPVCCQEYGAVII
jgi:hypothetical protein